MDNIPESINIAISWSSLLKLATISLISFALINIFKPILFIFRDWVVWEYINKKVLDKELSKSISKVVSSDAQLDCVYVHEAYADYMDPNNPLYSIGETAVGESEYNSYVSTQEALRNRRLNNFNIVVRRKMQLKRIDKYFDQNTYSLIDKEIEETKSLYGEKYTLDSIYRPQGLE